jgi:hypothetical protein
MYHFKKFILTMTLAFIASASFAQPTPNLEKIKSSNPSRHKALYDSLRKKLENL